MSYMATAKTKRMRGSILEILRANHDNQKSRFDSSALWSALFHGLAFDVSKNEVNTGIQDLCARGYVTCQQKKDHCTGDVWITQIELTPKGRDLLEETIADPAVEV